MGRTFIKTHAHLVDSVVDVDDVVWAGTIPGEACVDRFGTCDCTPGCTDLTSEGGEVRWCSNFNAISHCEVV